MSVRVKLLLGVAALFTAAALGFQRNPPVTPKDSPFNEKRVAAKTREYIVGELKKAGLTPELDEFDSRTPRGFKRMVNIRARRAGARPSLIAITGHYDTKLFDEIRFVGASDGGSSAAWLLEFARISAGMKLENTLEFIFFDGEEAVVEWTDDDSVYGSRHDVARRIRNNSLRDLKALILVDMIGDKNLNIRRETQSTGWLKDIIWETARSLGFSKEFPNDSIEISDDHVPYLREGIPAVDLIDFDYPHWHTAADTLDKVSARSLKIVGDVIYFSLPAIDKRLVQ
jgi:glutaminyl-peptide cyclotransferase